MGGAAGRAPVASTNRSARNRRPSTSTSGRTELGPAVDDVYSLAAEDLLVLGRGDLLDCRAHAPDGLIERLTASGGFDERLGRYAAGEGAVPTDRPVLHQQGVRAAAHPSPGCGHPARAAADDDQVMIRQGGTLPRSSSLHPPPCAGKATPYGPGRGW